MKNWQDVGPDIEAEADKYEEEQRALRELAEEEKKAKLVEEWDMMDAKLAFIC